MIDLQDVSKVYLTDDGEVRALDDLTLHVTQGEFVAVRGPSGCGKSTLLTLIGGLALPTSGTVTVAGQVISGMSASERASFRASHVGFVFQLFHLLPYLNVVNNVLVVRYLGNCTEQCREYFVNIWRTLRPSLLGRPARAPRIWNT